MANQLFIAAIGKLLHFLLRPRGIIYLKASGLGAIATGLAFDSLRGFDIKADLHAGGVGLHGEVIRSDMAGAFAVTASMLVLFVVIDAVLIAHERHLHAKLMGSAPPTGGTLKIGGPILVRVVGAAQAPANATPAAGFDESVISVALTRDIPAVPRAVFKKRGTNAP